MKGSQKAVRIGRPLAQRDLMTWCIILAFETTRLGGLDDQEGRDSNCDCGSEGPAGHGEQSLYCWSRCLMKGTPCPLAEISGGVGQA
jgi:hypothetical protein